MNEKLGRVYRGSHGVEDIALIGIPDIWHTCEFFSDPEILEAITNTEKSKGLGLTKGYLKERIDKILDVWELAHQLRTHIIEIRTSQKDWAVKGRDAGWHNEPTRHREAYYKGRRKKV